MLCQIHFRFNRMNFNEAEFNTKEKCQSIKDNKKNASVKLYNIMLLDDFVSRTVRQTQSLTVRVKNIFYFI